MLFVVRCRSSFAVCGCNFLVNVSRCLVFGVGKCWCLLCAVVCLVLFVVWCLLSVVCCPLSAVCCMLYVVCCSSLFVVGCLCVIVCCFVCSLLVVSCLLRVV